MATPGRAGLKPGLALVGGSIPPHTRKKTMAEQTLLKIGSGNSDFEQFGATDTIPGANMPPDTVISATVSSSQNNYTPTGGWDDADVVRLDFTAQGLEITGFAAWTNGRPKRLVNISANFVVLPTNHTASSAANRIAGELEYIIPAYSTAVIEYDSTSSLVRVVSHSFNPLDLTRGDNVFYSVCPGATLGSDWGTVAFPILGGNNSANPATASFPPTWGVDTSTSATGASGLYMPKTQVSIITWGLPAYKTHSCWVYFPTLSDGTQTYTFETGITTNPSTTVLAVSNSVFIRYTHSVNSGKFYGVVRNNGGLETGVDLGVTVAANTLYVLTVCHNAANTEARFYVNGAFSGVVTSGMPLGTAVCGTRSIIAKSAGTTSRAAHIAYKTFFALL